MNSRPCVWCLFLCNLRYGIIITKEAKISYCILETDESFEVNNWGEEEVKEEEEEEKENTASTEERMDEGDLDLENIFNTL